MLNTDAIPFQHDRVSGAVWLQEWQLQQVQLRLVEGLLGLAAQKRSWDISTTSLCQNKPKEQNEIGLDRRPLNNDPRMSVLCLNAQNEMARAC